MLCLCSLNKLFTYTDLHLLSTRMHIHVFYVTCVYATIVLADCQINMHCRFPLLLLLHLSSSRWLFALWAWH